MGTTTGNMNGKETAMGQSYAMSGVSFGRNNAFHATGDEEEDEAQYIDYEAEHVQDAFVPGPPPVTGSMVHRMNTAGSPATGDAHWE